MVQAPVVLSGFSFFQEQYETIEGSFFFSFFLSRACNTKVKFNYNNATKGQNNVALSNS